MTRRDLKEAFGDLYIESVIPKYDKIITGDTSYVEVDTFIEMFSDADLAYDKLCQLATDGWKRIFDKWKEQGILN